MRITVFIVFLYLCMLMKLRGHAAESEGAVSLPARPGRRHAVPLLQSSGHLCCARPLPQRLPVRLGCAAGAVPGSASILFIPIHFVGICISFFFDGRLKTSIEGFLFRRCECVELGAVDPCGGLELGV